MPALRAAQWSSLSMAGVPAGTSDIRKRLGRGSNRIIITLVINKDADDYPMKINR